MASWPAAPPGTYWPPELEREMNDLRVSPHDLDPDQVIRLFVPEAHAIDQAKDRRLWMLAGKLAEAEVTVGRGTQPRSEKQHLIETQEHHSRAIRGVLATSDRVELLEVDYPALVADPAAAIGRLAEILGDAFTADPAVAACVRPDLHRQRRATAAEAS